MIALQSLTSCGKPPQEIECVKLSPEKIELQRNEAIKDIQEMINNSVPEKYKEAFKVVSLQGEPSNELASTYDGLVYLDANYKPLEDRAREGWGSPNPHEVFTTNIQKMKFDEGCYDDEISVGVDLNIEKIKNSEGGMLPQAISDKLSNLDTAVGEKYNYMANTLNAQTLQYIAESHGKGNSGDKKSQEIFSSMQNAYFPLDSNDGSDDENIVNVKVNVKRFQLLIK